MARKGARQITMNLTETRAERTRADRLFNTWYNVDIFNEVNSTSFKWKNGSYKTAAKMVNITKKNGDRI